MPLIPPGGETGLFYIPLGNLPWDTTWQNLKDLLRELPDGPWIAGPCQVEHAEVYPKLGSGWVCVKGQVDFWRAYSFLNGLSWSPDGIEKHKRCIEADCRNFGQPISLPYLPESFLEKGASKKRLQNASKQRVKCPSGKQSQTNATPSLLSHPKKLEGRHHSGNAKPKGSRCRGLPLRNNELPGLSTRIERNPAQEVAISESTDICLQSQQLDAGNYMMPGLHYASIAHPLPGYQGSKLLEASSQHDRTFIDYLAIPLSSTRPISCPVQPLQASNMPVLVGSTPFFSNNYLHYHYANQPTSSQQPAQLSPAFIVCGPPYNSSNSSYLNLCVAEERFSQERFVSEFQVPDWNTNRCIPRSSVSNQMHGSRLACEELPPCLGTEQASGGGLFVKEASLTNVLPCEDSRLFQHADLNDDIANVRRRQSDSSQTSTTPGPPTEAPVETKSTDQLAPHLEIGRSENRTLSSRKPARHDGRRVSVVSTTSKLKDSSFDRRLAPLVVNGSSGGKNVPQIETSRSLTRKTSSMSSFPDVSPTETHSPSI